MGVLLVGATITGLTIETPAPAERAALSAPSAAPQPVLMEPPGGPILWGITAVGTPILLDGTPRILPHPGGTGALIQFEIRPACAGGELEVVRVAPGPRTVTDRDVQLAHRAYVPDGIYELTVLCGNTRRPTSRLEIMSTAR
jgi:hypothetical protein